MNTKSYEQWLDLINNEKGNTAYQGTTLDERTSYTFIYDCIENNFIFMDSGFGVITGHKIARMLPEFYMDLMHPDDCNYFLEKEKQIQEFTNDLRYNENFRYIFKYSLRLRKADGTYMLISQEYQAFEVNNQGCWSKSLVTHKVISNDTPICWETDYKVYDKLQGIYLDFFNRFNLTARELEIIKLIKEGLTSKEVSSKLNISTNTTLTHRKNILSKTQSKSFIELIKKMASSRY